MTASGQGSFSATNITAVPAMAALRRLRRSQKVITSNSESRSRQRVLRVQPPARSTPFANLSSFAEMPMQTAADPPRGGCYYFTLLPWSDGGAVGEHEPWRNSCFLSVGAGDNRGGLQHVRLQLAQC